MIDVDTYQSVAEPSEGLYKDRGSRFISYAYPIFSESEVKPLVDGLRKEHHAARHCCFAWRLGNEGKLFRSNDDGEPSGSAGRPILAAIDSAGVSDTLVVVVRYFGGILLGVPGLVQAYRGAAQEALNKAGRAQRTVTDSLELSFGYGELQTVLNTVRTFDGATTVSQELDLNCTLRLAVSRSRTEIFMNKIKSINDEKGTRIQCRPLQVAAECN